MLWKRVLTVRMTVILLNQYTADGYGVLVLIDFCQASEVSDLISDGKTANFAIRRAQPCQVVAHDVNSNATGNGLIRLPASLFVRG